MEAMAENHAREIGRLENIIHSQGKQIQKLESDDALKTSEIKVLLGKLGAAMALKVPRNQKAKLHYENLRES
jgi:hypothetical protein